MHMTLLLQILPPLPTPPSPVYFTPQYRALQLQVLLLSSDIQWPYQSQ